MQVMALIYGDASRWEAFSDDEREAVYAKYRAFSDEAGKAGVVAGGAELASTGDATTVRVRDGETLVTDGPYAEVKEALGGYFVFECESMDQAVEYAAKIPEPSTAPSRCGRSTSTPTRKERRHEVRDAHLRRRLRVDRSLGRREGQVRAEEMPNGSRPSWGSSEKADPGMTGYELGGGLAAQRSSASGTESGS